MRMPHGSWSSTFVLASLVLAACSLGTEPAAPPPPTQGIPDGWSGSVLAPYQVGITPANPHGGANAGYFSNIGSGDQTSFADLEQSIRADSYRGKRVRWSGWVKQTSVTGDDAGLWMRVDGPGMTDAFDNMSNRPLTGTADWHRVSVVLDVPQDAVGIALGVLLDGTGTLYVDDLTLDVVGTDVPSTAIVTNRPSGVDLATYARAFDSPLNTDFEGIATAASLPATVAWLTQHTVRLSTTDPTAPLDDLAPLQAMVGDAHVVGLGEGTHGTSEFFKLKHRMLEFLVEHDGFTHFAIEATTPEAEVMNHYVLTGEGNPKALLSRLYFWTWNTQEVLDMVEWMRQWNITAPAAQRVTFQGFDMQYPEGAVDSLDAFLSRVDDAGPTFLRDRITCIEPYMNGGAALGANPLGYASLPAATKASCAAGLQEVYDLLNTHADEYAVETSAAKVQWALHDARLVQQFESMISLSSAAASGGARDKAMAENVEWLRAQYPANDKFVLWAHNGHITSLTGTMGGYLRSVYGGDYVNLGFLFGTGFFNAVPTLGQQAGKQRATQLPPNSIEAIFRGTGRSLLLLDARSIASGGADAAPLAGPIPMRSIGALFVNMDEKAYFSNVLLPDDFDLLLYVDTTHETTLLPFSN